MDDNSEKKISVTLTTEQGCRISSCLLSAQRQYEREREIQKILSLERNPGGTPKFIEAKIKAEFLKKYISELEEIRRAIDGKMIRAEEEEENDMTSKRTIFTPEQGKTYTNAGGGTYRCLRSGSDGNAVMQNVKSLWTVQAHGCGLYEDGTIDWDYSTGGCFEEAAAVSEKKTINWEDLNELEEKVLLKIDQLASLSEAMRDMMDDDCEDLNNLSDLMTDTLKITKISLCDWIREQLQKLAPDKR